MSGTRNPAVSRAVEAARKLREEHPDWSRAKLAREASSSIGMLPDFLKPQTLKYRLETAPPDPPTADDQLPETPESGEVPVFVRDYTHLKRLRVYPIGDLHIGSPQHAEDALDQWFEYLAAADDVSILNTGDNTNCALKNAASEAYDDRLTVGEAREQQTEKFRPVADLFDAIIDGNHENRVYRATGDSPNAAVASALGINYARAACVVRYLVGDQQYDVFLRHGKGGGKKIGGAINNLQDQENVIDADVYVSGHTHTQVAFVKDIFVPDEDGGFERKKRLFVCSASFVGWEEYAAEAGYAPAHIGAPRIFLDGTKKDAHASV